jgi:hypothetical protein
VPIVAVPDHVAVAVPSIDDAATRWHDELGGGWLAPAYPFEAAGFCTRQLRYANGAKLELLEPLDDHGFAARFLQRFGAGVHHVTLKVEALLPAVEQLAAAGLDAVDVMAEGDVWHEAFLRPSQVGGMIVQVAWSGHTEEEWAAFADFTPEVPADDATRLLGPTLGHPDLDVAARVWTTLGADVDRECDRVVARWAGEPLDVVVAESEHAGPLGLRVERAPVLGATATHGAATLAA